MIVWLKCEDKRKCFDQRAKKLRVERETADAWFAAPVDNPACPVMQWPKFAWVLVAVSA